MNGAIELTNMLKKRSQIDVLMTRSMALQAQMIAFQTYNAQNGQQYSDTTFFAIEAEIKDLADKMQTILMSM